MVGKAISKKDLVILINDTMDKDGATRALCALGLDLFKRSSQTRADWGSGNRAMRRAGQFIEPRNASCGCGYCGCPHEVYEMGRSDWREHQASKRGIRKVKGAK